MKTITLQGTEERISKVQLNSVETRVYVVDSGEDEYDPTMNDEDFMTLAEQGGRVYTLPTFQEAFNFGDVNAFTDVIRFINVIKFD